MGIRQSLVCGACCKSSSPVYDDLLDEAQVFEIPNEIFIGRTIRVLDGDTIEAQIWNSRIGAWKIHIRIEGYDSPEIHTKNSSEKKHGRACKRYLEVLLGHRLFWFQRGGKDKWGRALGRIFYLEDKNAEGPFPESIEKITGAGFLPLDQTMIETTSSVPYFGKHKEKFGPHWFEGKKLDERFIEFYAEEA